VKQNLNPHFIYNSLNLIYALVLEKKNEAAVKTIAQFSSLHRYFLDNINKHEITLSEELRFIRNYLTLELLRVEQDRPFTFQLPEDVPTDWKELLVPAMLLQPLVENAVKYSTAENDVRIIWIDIRREDNRLIIGIENSNGERASQQNSGHGLGLSITAERIDVFNKSNRSDVTLLREVPCRYARMGYRCEVII
jgi:LytS/YehU family sensor histidine kinase